MVSKIENRSKMLTYLLAIFFLATPLDYVLPHFGTATVLMILGIVICALLCGLLLVNPNARISRDQVYILFLVSIVIVSNLWAKDLERSYSHTFSLVATALMYFLLFYFRFSKKEIELFEIASMVGGAMFIIYVFTKVDLANVSLGYRLDLEYVGNSDYYSDPNGLAARLMMPTALFIKWLLESKKVWIKLVCLASLLAIVYVIFLTGSRAAVLTLALMFVIIFWYYGSKNTSLALVLIACGLIVLIFIPDLLPQHIYERIFSLGSYQDMSTNEEDRLHIWEIIITKIFPQSPFIGYGAGNSCVALEEYYGMIKATHNSFFAPLVDFGLVGFLPWVFIAFGKIMEAFHLRKKSIYALAIMLGVFLMANTLDAEKEKFLWNGFLYVYLIYTMYDSDEQTIGNNKKLQKEN